jgi:hypothetical protein
MTNMRIVKNYFVWILLMFFSISIVSCGGEGESQASQNDTELDSLEDDFDDEDFDDEDFDDEDFDDVEQPTKKPVLKKKPAKSVVKKATTQKGGLKDLNKGQLYPKRKASSRGSSSTVAFRPAQGGWVVQESNGQMFIVSFKDENSYSFTEDLASGHLEHKGMNDWRLPTFDEATYLLDIMPFAKMAASQTEFWTSTKKGNNAYIFNPSKGSYRLSSLRDSSGVLLVRTL